MASISARRVWLAATILCGLGLLIEPAVAQTPPTPTPAAIDADRNSPAYTVSVDSQMTVRSDLTATVNTTMRYKVLRESAIRTLGQLSLSYTESLNPLAIVEAYTEKADGRKVPVDQGQLLTRDAATGLNAIYQRDAKVKTLIFPDVEVGDTLVYVSHSDRIDKRFPGHFHFRAIFPHSVPYDTYRLTVDAPSSLGLKAHVRGDGLTHEAAEANAGQRDVFSYHPKSWMPEEPGAVSSADRDPQFEVTTFRDFTALGASYWSSMQDQDVVAPEIQALAEQITKGIDDKRAQAIAIDRWVKKNIRYVLVFLGSGGITPNPAASVLKNKFGDCKDHVALMGALLRVKGIASEQALVNLGNTYRLPDMPVPSFNHVMLYLPDFNLYTDPTASNAAFGILPESSYDKPVLHISPSGGRLARTPAMKMEDHLTTASTTASEIQAQGREKFAESLLRNLGRPGTGVFEPAMPSDLTEPYSVQGDFSLNEKLQMPLSGARDIPIGMPIHSRPGVGLLGPRVAGRTTDFACYAGKQVEEIELTFAEGLPPPKAIKETAVDSRYFSYRASHAINGRTLMIRREFVSKVTGQVCAKEIEAEISESMQRVARSLRTQMSF